MNKTSTYILYTCYCVKTHFYFSELNAQDSNQETILKDIIFNHLPHPKVLPSLLPASNISWASKGYALAGVSNFYQMPAAELNGTVHFSGPLILYTEHFPNLLPGNKPLPEQ